MSALQGVFSIVAAIAGAIAGRLVEPVMLHVGFVFQYKKKQENLEVEIKNLEELIEQIKEKVDEAITRGEKVDEPVSNWLTEVEERVLKFKDENIVNENMQCFAFLCPDYISRYRMSKEAENKIAEVKKFTQSGNFSSISLPKPFAQELQFTSSSTNYVNFESRKSVLNSIMAALRDSNVKMIGVYGTGGVGKTTMVEEIGKLVKNGLFDEVVVAVVSQDANVSNIQGQLADRLNLKLKGKTKVGKASKLWNRLNNGKKNLIILDDMWQELNLQTIGIPITDGNNCCKVVITSRIRGVLEMMRVDKYVSMKVLLEKEAWALFKTKVGNSVDSPELHDIADAVCKECGGLPVAILAVGATLKDKKKYVWEDVLDQFKDSMLKNIAGIDTKVYASLKLSYDRLESSDAKSCFLLCCFFPEDANISIEVLARHCIARSLLGQNTNTLRRASRRVHTVIDILKDSCLLLEGENENFVKMHDVIRDVALSIVKDDGKEILVKHGDKKWPEKDTCESSSAMSLRFDNTLELPDDLLCPQLHTLTILLKWNINPLLNVPDRFFSGMEKLTILELNRICMLPPLSLANLVNLRMLWLEDCELGDMAILKDLNNNLEILSLRGSNIEVLPSEIGQLTGLRLLDLGNCYQLIEIPQGVISNLSRLEELYILDEYVAGQRKEISKMNLGELGKLTQLTTLEIYIPNVMLLPKDFRFENLISFKISAGMGKEYDFYGSYSKSCELDKLIVLWLRAKELHLENIEGLQEVLHDRGGEGSLMERHGLNPSGFFNDLIHLKIEDCRLEYLFSLSCARGFPRLQTLEIFDCEMMEAIVRTEEGKYEDELSSPVINFSQLEYLHLKNLPKLISFYPKVEKMSTSEGNSSTQAQFLFNEKVAFPVLEVLKICELPNIKEIWDKQLLIASEKETKSFCQLKDMVVFNCEKLVHVVQFNMLPRLQNLKIFIVDNCPKMEVIVSEKEKEEGTTNNDIILFSQLTTLNLFRLVSIKSFYNLPTRSEAQPLFNHQVAFPVLEVLKICELPNIKEIWEKQLLIASEKESKSFCQLKDMVVFNCEKLVHVVQFNMLPRLQNLKIFIVDNCPKMEAIVSEKEKEEGTTNNDIILFSQLTTLNLFRLVSVKSFYNWPTRSEAQPLFNHQVAFPVLEVLKISELPNIIEIWDKELLIASEKESKSFCQLKVMEVFNCEKLVHVVQFNMLPRLQNLETFNIDNCPMMEAIVSEKGKEGSTSNDIIVLKICELPNIKEIWDKQLLIASEKESKSFYQLKDVAVFNCEKLVAFPVLEVLQIGELPNIIEIWDKQLLIASEKESKSFCQLKVMEVLNCEKLVHVVQFNMLPRLQNLKIFIVDNCPKMEAIVSEKEKEEGTTNNDIILFSQLTTLQLSRLVSVKSFYNWPTRFDAQPLFNHQVAFPVLEDLKIHKLPNIIEIWDEQLLIASEKESKSFCQLKDMQVSNCEKLVHVVQFNMLSRLQNLETFNVDHCPKMEAIVSEKAKEEGTTSNDIILFSKLTTLNLSELVSLKSFYSWPTRFEVQPLFNHKVAFPVLEDLKIQKLPNIIEIWDEQLLITSEKESKSFCQLKDMQVSNCEKLVHVVLFNMLPRLQNLKNFNVDNCPRMEAIVSEKEKEEGTTKNDIIVFSQLRTLNLSELVSLKSFCNGPTRSKAQPLFNHQVTFPVLEDLNIKKLPNIIEIWDEQLLIASEKESMSFCQLKDMQVSNCEKLVHVVLFNMLPRLQNLKKFNVDNCPRMEAILSEKKEEGTTRNDIIDLKIQKLPNIIEIWDEQLLIASEKELKSFCQLKDMQISNCEKLVHVVLFNMLPRLQNLKKFKVDNCPRMEAIVLEEEKKEGTTRNDIIVFSQLTTLNLSELVSLKSFCNGPTRFEAQPLFNNQVAFPVLEVLEIQELPNITEIWDKQLLMASEEESKSFCQLKDMTASNCEKLVHVVQFNMLSRLQNLETFNVDHCPKMEAIVSKKGKEEGTTSNDVIVFSQLTTLNLSELVSLKSFYNWPTRSEAQPLFNHQVAFPVLEDLKIQKLPNIIEIWDEQLLIASEKESKSFCQLKDMQVSNCEKLVHVVRFNMLPRLQNLKKFKEDNCPRMEAIVLEKEKEEGTTRNDIIVFSQLTTLNLSELVSLKSFCNGPTRFEAQPLFNNQVAFPVLEVLEIQELPNITEIWDKQLLMASEQESKSFCQLKDMTASNCEKLVHVVQFNMLSRLQNLETFNVDHCPKMETIVSEKGKEEGTTSNDVIVFSQLTTLNLSELVSLKSFYNWPTRSEAQPLFNHQVAFPVLEVLEIQELPNITEIWDKQLLMASEQESKSFCQLKDMTASNCEKLVHVVQFNMLSRLQNLETFNVDHCPKMEAIVSENGKEEGTTSNDVIVFSQLTTLNLSELVSLKSFYNWPTRSEAQPLFNHQVSFPKLETLLLDNCVNSREIHPWNVQAGKISLKFLDVANLDKLIVRNCSEVAEVFQLEGLNVGGGQHVRPLIEVRMMELDGLPQLTCLWNKDPHGILSLQILQYLTIKKCSLLRNLFTCSTAMALQQLKVLYLESCPVIEEVIAATEDGLKEVIDDVIEFPKLEWLILKDLPNLNSFCNAKYNFNLPSLQRVVLMGCSNMHNFTFGQVRMSQIFVSTHGNDGLQIEDLNKYLKEQLLLKGEECATVDENDHYGDEVRFSDLEWLYG
ncbi:Disease resistance protein [Camellia lanceoleosa]|uniref:Disease resistance protein n=1 Tax=Camellia lanceoleosa TaxID=1840588 RepID=A0ACC0H8H5_9ERIC|nr:Disease resistance protein [Camellia lanceoleosa]